MEGMKPETQRRKAMETLAVYGPLAESFGLWQVKNVLQDLSFQYVDPRRYHVVKEQIDRDPRLTEKFIEQREREIQRILNDNGIVARVEHQVGGYFEMAEKQKKYGMMAGARTNSFADITDVISFHIIVGESKASDCYCALGVMRLAYDGKLMKQRHNDYLSTPSANGYSALHDTYKFDEGDVEFSITTEERERFNNWGVVSLDKNELRQNPERYRRKLIFTPKKELVFMEMAATGIDTAYKLNPLLGLRAVGMIVDGKMCDLNSIVPNASVVEVVCDPEQIRPRQEWLRYCDDSTRRLIEQQLLVSQRDDEVTKGKVLLSTEVLRERGILNLADLRGKCLDKLLLEMGCWHGLTDLYYKVAYGFDLGVVKRKMDEAGIVKGMYTSIEVNGENRIGVSKDVASIVSKNGGDARSKVERVDEQERFVIRILLTVGYEGKKKIEEELRRKYPDCVVV
jgi:GTP pyrophosphokinase